MVLTGIYEKTLFRNEDNGYTVFALKCKFYDDVELLNEFGNITCCGNVQSYASGIPVRVIGEKECENNKYIFKIDTIEPFSDQLDVTIDYLSSNTFKGIGPVTAKKIVDITGPNIFSFFIQENAAKILNEKIPELTASKINNLILTVRNTAMQKRILDVISPFGGKFSNAKRIYEKYGVNAISELEKNPYAVGRAGDLPFPICDEIGKKYNFKKFSPERLFALIDKVMQCNESVGNTCLSLDDFHDFLNFATKQLSFKDNVPMSVLAPILSSSKKIKVIKKDNTVFLESASTWQAEKDIAFHIHRLLSSKKEFVINSALISSVEAKIGVKYSLEQEHAFKALSSSGVKILTGGPGTGKSTVINGLIEGYSRIVPNAKIYMCAPTGRAAQRMSEITGKKAFTIHRLLDVKPFGEEFTCKDLKNPIDADLIIVDEISMADTFIMSMLLGAVQNGTTLILSGDIDQLPSVGPGNILKDLINSNSIDVYKLTAVYRQKEDSDIISDAIAIKNGNNALKTGNGVEVIRVKKEDEVINAVEALTKKYYDKNDIFKMQILSTTKKNLCGTVSLNKIMQSLINNKEVVLESENTSFKIGDKVMTIKNNYEAGYFNGDIGVIKDIDFEHITIDINGEEIAVDIKNAKDIILAYAITTHKSQGSEFDTVVVVLPETPRNMLQRNLLYTAITRAKKELIIISVKDALNTAIKEIKISQRKTMLPYLLKNIH